MVERFHDKENKAEPRLRTRADRFNALEAQIPAFAYADPEGDELKAHKSLSPKRRLRVDLGLIRQGLLTEMKDTSIAVSVIYGVRSPDLDFQNKIARQVFKACQITREIIWKDISDLKTRRSLTDLANNLDDEIQMKIKNRVDECSTRVREIGYARALEELFAYSSSLPAGRFTPPAYRPGPEPVAGSPGEFRPRLPYNR